MAKTMRQVTTTCDTAEAGAEAVWGSGVHVETSGWARHQ
jgi:hypothetical protein